MEERVAELEERVARLESGASVPTASGRSARQALWALDGLRDRVPDGSGGAVLFTGFLELPTGEHYEWQQGAMVEDLVPPELDHDWSTTASALAALGHPVRLLLLHAILRGTRTAAELAELDGVGTTGQIYHHLRQLTAAGWLHTSSRAQYAPVPERVIPLLAVLAASR